MAFLRNIFKPGAYEQTPEDKAVQQELISCGRIPEHVAIIMDGNGRWAEERRFPRAVGHQAGIASVRDITRASRELGIRYLTLYAFSTENWKRPRKEVAMLMRLLRKMLHDELEEMRNNGVRLTTIGQTNALPKEVQQDLFDAVEQTSGNNRLTLTLALSYSGRWDIVRAMQMMALDIRRGKLSPEDVNDGLVKSYLTTSEMPDPDLMIRTSGEMRLSNFLLWEVAYSEMYVTKIFWPDFRREHLYEAIKNYQSRERRYGMTGEQIKAKDSIPQEHSSYVKQIVSALTKRNTN
ncbi:MAG TPA: isoprenyl transferase [Candidatus Kapabacteria bacterium]|nr:isoprenyl transferase [Candidatus Kapabacteria bacterium]